MATDSDEDQTPQEKREKPRPARYWHNQIQAALKREEKWRYRAKQVYQRYVDERDSDALGYKTDEISRINMLWSNTEVLKSVLFANLGKPDIARNFPKPGKDNKVSRQAALILERAVSAACDYYDPEREIEDAITDYLVAGRGQAWLELDAIIEEYYEAEDEAQENPKQRVGYHEIEICHVPHADWVHGPGKKWEQVPWVARLHLFDKTDVKEQWGDDIADELPYNYMLMEGVGSDGRNQEIGEGVNDFKRAKIWEIWDKRSKARIYVAEGHNEEIERTPDPYKLDKFFPCPKPLYGVKTPGNLLPRPEYLQYQDLCQELDRVNTRLQRLVEALKLCGVYDASNDSDDVLKNLGMLDDGQFLPFKNFASLAQGGGLAAAFQVRDTKPYADAIIVLAQRAQEIIQLIYEVTGISDVVRGATDPRETAAAQRLKARFGTQRIQKRQKEVQRFVADLYKLKAELIAEHFEPKQLSEMSGIDIPTNAEKAQAQQILMLAQRRQQMLQQQQALQQQMQAAASAQQQAPAGVTSQPGQPMPQQPQPMAA